MINKGYDNISDLIFSLREDPFLAKELFNFFTVNKSRHKYISDNGFLMYMFLMFFDNPFNQSSRASDSNFEFFNLLRCFKIYLDDEYLTEEDISQKLMEDKHIS